MSDIISAFKKAAIVFKTEMQSDSDQVTVDTVANDVAKTTTDSQLSNKSNTVLDNVKQTDSDTSIGKSPSPTDDSQIANATKTADKSQNDSNIEPSSATKSGTQKSTTVAGDGTSDSITDVQQTTEESIIRHSSYLETNEWKVAGLSLRGRAHIADGSECQDFHSIESLDNDNKWVINVVSDGAGSAKQSARGSNANCKLACQMFKLLVEKQKWIDNNYFPTEKEWYVECHAIFSTIKSVIVSKANESNVEPREFNATILVLITTPRGILVAHIGDGRMGYQTKDNQWHSAINPHKGEEANQTVFIPNQWNAISIPAFRMSGIYLPETRTIETDQIKSYVIMSDGCEHAMWICHQFDKEEDKFVDINKPGERFLNPLINDLKELEGENLNNRMKFIMREGTSVCLREKDDQTLVVGLLR